MIAYNQETTQKSDLIVADSGRKRQPPDLVERNEIMKKKYWYFIAALVIIAAVVAAICLFGTSSKDAAPDSEELKGKPETVPVIT